MLVTSGDLRKLQGSLTMVDGGFDPLHGGHIDYLEAAARLGRPVLCNVAPDAWILRKHPPLLPQAERARIIDSLRFVDYTHLSQGTTEAVLEILRPRCYAKGSDWKGRLPQEQLDLCERLGVEIVYLETVTNSSTAILRRYAASGGQAG